ncbi:hypothetical protein [Glycomyces paridis]|uniref:Uncharacterized protein n=1 Tax=Glycomyces paridis TaxID=2126555 RepID=A0A4S8PAN4_9ACTN|nr:hypothetical protein [Glycomyces paridis]THV27328.1 hypothetical protein E9998_15870 [Glycomyces paridis]
MGEPLVWVLRDGGRAIGRVTIDGNDFPWLHGVFEPLEGFEAVRPLFERSLRLLEEERYEEWESAYGLIDGRLTFDSPDGPVAEFLLHIENDRAWFRWSDTAD